MRRPLSSSCGPWKPLHCYPRMMDRGPCDYPSKPSQQQTQASLEVLLKRKVKFDSTHSTFEYFFLVLLETVSDLLCLNIVRLFVWSSSRVSLFCKVSTAQIIEPPAHVTQHWLESTMDICETHTWSSQPPPETYLKEHQSIKEYRVQIYIWQLVSD